MAALAVLVVALLAGIVLRRIRAIPVESHRVLDVWVLDVALPALALHALHDIEFPPGVIAVIAAPWLLFGVTALILLALARPMRWDRQTYGALLLSTGLANTSFVGLPMVAAFFGAAAVPIALLADQLGSFLVLATVAVAVAAVCSGARVDAGSILRRVVTSPPLVAVVAGLALRPVTFPDWTTEALITLGATLTPVALFSVGLQLRIGYARDWRRELVAGLTLKLLVAPLIITLLYVALGLRGEWSVQIALFEVAMPPMVTGALLATRHGLAGPLPSLLVGIGIPLSFLTLPVWSWVLQR